MKINRGKKKIEIIGFASLSALLLGSPVSLPLVALAQTQAQDQAQTQAQSASVSVSGESLRRQMEDNTKKTLRAIIDMERYNLNYRLNVAKQGSGKAWRYFASQEANAAISVAGYTVGTAERCGHFQRASKLARIYLENGNYLNFTAQIIGGSGSAAEFGINCFHDLEARKHGYSPSAARKKVLAFVHEFERLLTERRLLIGQLSQSGAMPRYLELATIEESVLADMRDLALSEFQMFHTGARGYLVFQQTLYLFDVARNACGAVGSHCGWAGLQTGDRHYNETAGILGDLSGIITMLNPVVSRAVGRAVSRYEKHRIRACFDGAKPGDVDRMKADVSALNRVATSADLERADYPVLRTAIYTEHEDGCKNQLSAVTREQRAGFQIAAENIGSGAFIGVTKVANGILYNVAGDRYVKKGRRSNVMLGSANIVGLVGNTYATCENLRIQVSRQISENRLSREHKLPGQVIKERLATLDQMEKQLRI